jgi:hypothetical protein
MGYYDTPEPEAAPRVISCASLKTHTPGSPVKERGHRYYSPGMGRWCSRDPIYEWGFETARNAAHGADLQQTLQIAEQARSQNLLSFIDNRPVAFVDVLGLSINAPPPCAPYPDCLHPPTPPPPPQYPNGFAICRRNVHHEGKCDCVAMVADACGGEHTYIQYVDTGDEGPRLPWGWGFCGGDKTTPERYFHPSICKSCKKTGAVLKYGSGAGNVGGQATDDEIKDCIMKRKPTKRYSYPAYVCSDWAKEAAQDCGLNCN